MIWKKTLKRAITKRYQNNWTVHVHFSVIMRLLCCYFHHSWSIFSLSLCTFFHSVDSGEFILFFFREWVKLWGALSSHTNNFLFSSYPQAKHSPSKNFPRLHLPSSIFLFSHSRLHIIFVLSSSYLAFSLLSSTSLLECVLNENKFFSISKFAWDDIEGKWGKMWWKINKI